MKKTNVFKVLTLSLIGLMGLGSAIAANRSNKSVSDEVKEVGAVSIPADSTVYMVPNDNWKRDSARFAIYIKHANGDEQWSDLTSCGDGRYSYTFNSNSNISLFIFCRMNPNSSGNNWNNKWNQTSDLTFGAFNEKNTYFIEGWDKGAGNWSYTRDAGFYVVGKFGSGNFDLKNAVLMENTDDKADSYDYEVAATIKMDFHDSFRVVYYSPVSDFDWNGETFGFSHLQQDGARYCFTAGSSDNNILCYANGTYKFRLHNYPNAGKMDKTIYSSVQSTTSETLAAKIMGYDVSSSAGETCESRFYEINSYFCSLPETGTNLQQTAFKSYSSFVGEWDDAKWEYPLLDGVTNDKDIQMGNAYRRYMTWARVLGYTGDSMWSLQSKPESGTDTLIGRPISIVDSIAANDSSVLLIAIATITAVAAAGYFMINSKKKYSSK